MTKDEAAVIAKIAVGPWSREATPELIIAFGLALENFSYPEAVTAIGVLLNQSDRQFPPNPGEIVGQIQAAKRGSDSTRKYFRAADLETPAVTMSQEEKLHQIAELRQRHPELFK